MELVWLWGIFYLDYSGDMVNRRSRTIFTILLNNAPIYWFSNKQTIVEASSFVSEFVAMKKCCEYIRGLLYNISMIGISTDEQLFLEITSLC